MSGDDSDREKISVDLEQDAPYARELLWAGPRGGGVVELDNIPWFAYGLNWGDSIRVAREAGDLPRFVGVERRGGHQTVRVHLRDEAQLAAVLDAINRTGGRSESWGNLLAVDLPPGSAVDELLDELDVLEAAGSLAWEAGYLHEAR